MIQEDNNSSYTWKFLLKSRNLSQGIERKLAKGHDTSLWFKPWLNGESLINILEWQQLTYSGGTTKEVAALISNSEWSLYNLSLPSGICNQITNIHIYNNLSTDFCSWKPNHNGEFSLRSA